MECGLKHPYTADPRAGANFVPDSPAFGPLLGSYAVIQNEELAGECAKPECFNTDSIRRYQTALDHRALVGDGQRID